jgi:hypothetical protein
VSGAVVARWLRPPLVVPSDTGAMRSAVRPSA